MADASTENVKSICSHLSFKYLSVIAIKNRLSALDGSFLWNDRDSYLYARKLSTISDWVRQKWDSLPTEFLFCFKLNSFRDLRPVWWFVILVWIIMVLSDDKSYCLVLLSPHTFYMASIIYIFGLTRTDQARQLLWGKMPRGQIVLKETVSCNKSEDFRGHLPHF